MKKRKLDINEVKKISLRGRQAKTITTKYEALLAFFKRKDPQSNKIFTTQLQPLVTDLIDQLSNAQISYKLLNQIQSQIHTVQIQSNSLKFDTSYLKNICKEYPIQQIMNSVQIKKDSVTNKVGICVINQKLMVFFKHLRLIFPEFCYSTGQKIILDTHDLRTFYQAFKCEWNKIHQKGKVQNCQKIQKLICRSLYFFGATIQNNILNEIAEQQRLKKQQAADIGTKSEKKPVFKILPHPVSSTYSFQGEVDMYSFLSSSMITQRSNQQVLCKTAFSQKSEKLVRKQKNCKLWQTSQIKNLKIRLNTNDIQNKPPQNTKFQIDLLSNDVENVIIQQAFKIERLRVQASRYHSSLNSSQSYIYHPYQNYYPPYYNNCYSPLIYPQMVSSQQKVSNKRAVNYTNLVQTRKTHSRLENKKDYC